MCSDKDIKIASSRPSKSPQFHKTEPIQNTVKTETKKAAKQIGEKVAELFADEVSYANIGEMDNGELISQRRLLLCFTAIASLENYISDEAVSDIAKKSFLDTLKKMDMSLYKASSEMGAFSFYYLALRRGTDVIRRIGQTFAMLCSHDGDPIFQEMGEALYCWFSSQAKKTILELLK
ncbi:MAG: hypothetical protein J6J13_03170 [Clostridia bacterium]|nr:hypothetical protein [Clostridia bacterium]